MRQLIFKFFGDWLKKYTSSYETKKKLLKSITMDRMSTTVAVTAVVSLATGYFIGQYITQKVNKDKLCLK